MEIEMMINDYETFTSELLVWTEDVIKVLGNRRFAILLRDVQKQFDWFNGHRNTDKIPKLREKGILKVSFNLQSKMRAQDKVPCTPKDEKIMRDINLAWERLEKAEHEHELALREELLRQEILEQLVTLNFNRKASMKETWHKENQRLVSQDNF